MGRSMPTCAKVMDRLTWHRGEEPWPCRSIALPIHELAALGTATCRAATGIIASDTIRALGAFHCNLARQAFVTLILAGIVLASGTLALPGREVVLVLATSPVVILPLLWLRTGQRPGVKGWLGAGLAVAGLALIFTR